LYRQLLEGASNIQCESFIELIEESKQLLIHEKGKIGDHKITGRLIKTKPKGNALIVSDLHGDLKSLEYILKESDFLRRAKEKEDLILIFLGDYGDRGLYSTEVYYVVLKLKLSFPKSVILLRGNHEGPRDLMVSPHDLPSILLAKFGKKWKAVYSKICELFEHLYNAVVIEETFLLLHGGLPINATTYEDFAYAHIKHPKQSFLEEILWSDPVEGYKGSFASPRGAGRLFGEDITEKALKRFNVKFLIRGHEPCKNGFKFNHGGKVLTLFSRKGPPYNNQFAGYLEVDLTKQITNIKNLIPSVRQF
jgi:protein phosphatase